jgi:hypothetical protein
VLGVEVGGQIGIGIDVGLPPRLSRDRLARDLLGPRRLLKLHGTTRDVAT